MDASYLRADNFVRGYNYRAIFSKQILENKYIGHYLEML